MKRRDGGGDGQEDTNSHSLDTQRIALLASPFDKMMRKERHGDGFTHVPLSHCT